MNQNEAIELLKKEATKNAAYNAILHIFALRQRARSQVTVQGLTARMEKEQFFYSKKEYADFLRLMASLGFGKLVTGPRGDVKALVDIKTTLQSIGAAACGQKTKLQPYKSRNKYSELPNTRRAASILSTQEAAVSPSGAVAGFPVSITVVINGKAVNFRVPKDLNEKEIADLVVRFRDKAVL